MKKATMILALFLAVSLAAPAAYAVEDYLDFGGAVRINYTNQSYSDRHERIGGDFAFDLFRIDVNGSYSDIMFSAQYRWNSYSHFVHHGWLGYQFTDNLQGQVGLTKVPFGLLPYASFDFWETIGYYIGLEDDYDMGLKLIWEDGPLNIQGAFFKNADWGNAGKLERYSYDLVTAGGDNNEEVNQGNLRMAYTLDHGSTGSTELGVSGEYGQVWNSVSDEHGAHWATAAHVDGNYGPVSLKLMWARYGYDLENPIDPATGTVLDEQTVRIGAFADSYDVAANGDLYVACLAYGLPVEWGPVTKLTFYNDYSMLDKREDSFEDSRMNTLGCMITAGKVYTYVDFIMGENMVYLGAPADALAAATNDEGWETRFNVNIGIYF